MLEFGLKTTEKIRTVATFENLAKHKDVSLENGMMLIKHGSTLLESMMTNVIPMLKNEYELALDIKELDTQLAFHVNNGNGGAFELAGDGIALSARIKIDDIVLK